MSDKSTPGKKNGTPPQQTKANTVKAAPPGFAKKNKPPQEAPRIEDLILAIPELNGTRENPIFTSFLDKIAPKFVIGKTSLGFLEEFANVDVTADRIGHVLQRNPYYEYMFQKIIEAKAKREEKPSMEAAVVLLGMQNSRNIILAMQLVRTIRQNHIEFSEGGELILDHAAILKYALLAEEALAKSRESSSDLAFDAGLIFDYLFVIADVLEEADTNKVYPFIDEVFKHSLKAAKIGLEISNRIPDFTYKKYVFSACLLHDVGKIIISMLDSTYMDFIESCNKLELTRGPRHFAEKRKFGINHEVFSSLVCNYFSFFRIVEEAIRFHHFPYLIKKRNDKQLLLFSTLIHVASNMTNEFKDPTSSEDPILTRWKGRGLEDFPLSKFKLIELMKDLKEKSAKV